jgi:hypothetical protein
MVVGGDCRYRRQTGNEQRSYQNETKHVDPPNCFIVPAEITAQGRKEEITFDLKEITSVASKKLRIT